MKTLSKFFIFCIVGGLSFLIDIVFVNIFFYLGLPFPVSRTFSIIIALIFKTEKIIVNKINKTLILFLI